MTDTAQEPDLTDVLRDAAATVQVCAQELLNPSTVMRLDGTTGKSSGAAALGALIDLSTRLDRALHQIGAIDPEFHDECPLSPGWPTYPESTP
jgi:hypothetical protein